jgi:hypothetical protein
MPVISTTQEDLQFKRSSGKVRETYLINKIQMKRAWSIVQVV